MTVPWPGIEPGGAWFWNPRMPRSTTTPRVLPVVRDALCTMAPASLRPAQLYVHATSTPGFDVRTSAARRHEDVGAGRAKSRSIHVLGKDILKFHAIYWPAILFAVGLPPPQQLVVHGWGTKDGKKISKKDGNTFDPLEKVAEYGP